MDEGQRVLVVDDHMDGSELLCMHLERLGHTCREAKDGTSAIEIALDFKPHVAILDLWLPDKTGHEVGRALRDRDPHVYLIALTGSSRAEDRAAAIDAGFDEYLMKPTDGTTLRQLLAKAKSKRSV